MTSDASLGTIEKYWKGYTEIIWENPSVATSVQYFSDTNERGRVFSYKGIFLDE